jgi:protoheme IX farnesyltransferase
MALLKIYFELAKARLSSLVLLTTLVGMILAVQESIWSWRLLWTMVGTGLAAGGANALNQWLERETDARMQRTRRRPLPAGLLSPRHALLWGLATAAAGVSILAWQVNLLAASLALSVVLLYTLIYTPLKRRSSLSTLVGAVCGAIPPLIGWAAGTGRLELGAWLLGAILFVWQMPHFFALGWLYRRDYARGGFKLLPVVDPRGDLTCRVLVMFAMVLVPLSLTVTLAGVAGPLFAFGSALLGMVWLATGIRLFRQRTDANARRVFLGSLLYLPLVLGLMVVDRGSGSSTPALAAPADTSLKATTVVKVNNPDE